MQYNESSIRVLSEEEAANHSAFGIAYALSNTYPSLSYEHIKNISGALFITGIDVSLYERRYCSPIGTIAPDNHFSQDELNTLFTLQEAFKNH
ncbi:hypothetical protein [Leclercia adecarboxylata]|uniref:hypothetical protein n=1 Tax=Leclercia adecarboxylata TaxID=83655 RepID=UPI00294A2D8E|nr:hypothetical protein [Leclercia adecarboxylata]MDV5240172.1 hypothetical protein [Leclercia adecarboxylata]MDV5276736.1 hypothetical protein [Leclercia adecarboxylata]MDV5460681.1 hypothetical protein [Leclercia adecarboxylata]MDV5504172.1 hypothetical protein [Leclercia adecarboxylata]MDV5534711.1 hypothetical protein [Leclercia adecarboxylata]